MVLFKPHNGGIVFVKRAISPCKGQWALPGGFIEMGETVENAGARELLEETALHGTPARFIGVHIQRSRIYGYVLVVGLEYTVKCWNLVPGDDASEAGIIAVKNMPKIPFASHRKLISQFLKLHI